MSPAFIARNSRSRASLERPVSGSVLRVMGKVPLTLCWERQLRGILAINHEFVNDLREFDKTEIRPPAVGPEQRAGRAGMPRRAQRTAFDDGDRHDDRHGEVECQ